MSKMKKITLPDGRTIIECGGDKLTAFMRGRFDYEFMKYYTSGMYDYVKYHNKFLLVSSIKETTNV